MLRLLVKPGALVLSRIRKKRYGMRGSWYKLRRGDVVRVDGRVHVCGSRPVGGLLEGRIGLDRVTGLALTPETVGLAFFTPHRGWYVRAGFPYQLLLREGTGWLVALHRGRVLRRVAEVGYVHQLQAAVRAVRRRGAGTETNKL